MLLIDGSQGEGGGQILRTSLALSLILATLFSWEIQGVPIPLASPRLLWRMKVITYREKDAGDLVFLRYWFSEHGEEPPK